MKFLSLTSDNKIKFKREDGRYHTRKLRDNIFVDSGTEYKFDRNTNSIELYNGEPTKSEIQFDINERFNHLETFVDMTIDGIVPSVVICGEAGLGKSYTVMNRFDKKNKIEDEDYVIVKGYTTAKGLYKILYENRFKTIVLDDIDSVFKDDTSLNLLKAALDSYSKRIVTWNSVSFADDGLPEKFEFFGQIVFITNKSLAKLDGAVKSRSLTVDVSMTTDEKIDRMREISKVMLPEISLSTKNKVVDFIGENSDIVKELNLRTLIKGIKIFESTGDMRPVQYMLANS